MKDLKDKVAIVTGAGSGIGRAIAILYASNEIKIVVSDIDEKGGKETVKIISTNGGEAVFIKSDSSSAEQKCDLLNIL